MTKSVPSFLTLEQISSDLQIDVRTLRTWAKRGYLPTVKLGRDYRVRRVDYMKWIGEHMTSKLPK
jgi:excisionase family DNA binding protein